MWPNFVCPIGGQGWPLQAAARVLAREVPYREVAWVYGPVPICLLVLTFEMAGIDASVSSFLCISLSFLTCLLTYRVARFLLSAPLAFLGTATVFMARSGGIRSYADSYTTAVLLGAVLGLVFAVSLMRFLLQARSYWLVLAGAATGAALATKPDFALACMATGGTAFHVVRPAVARLCQTAAPHRR